MRIHTAIVLCLSGLLAACERDSTASPSPSAQVLEAGWSFGFCIGPCRGTLQFDGTGLAYRVSDRTGNETFVLNRGSLTTAGRASFDALQGALPESLQSSYGCPDCADAGAAYVVVGRSGETVRSEYEFPNPPPELAAIDAFLKSVTEALGNCQATSDVALDPGCQPLD